MRTVEGVAITIPRGILSEDQSRKFKFLPTTFRSLGPSLRYLDFGGIMHMKMYTLSNSTLAASSALDIFRRLGVSHEKLLWALYRHLEERDPRETLVLWGSARDAMSWS